MKTFTRRETLIGAVGAGLLSLAMGACGNAGDIDGGGGGAAPIGPATSTSAVSTSAATGSGMPGEKAQVRVVHASPDAPKIDVYAKGLDEPLLQDMSYGDTSGYLVLDPGKYTIELRAAPSTSADPVAYSVDLDIKPGARITAVAAGLLGSNGDADKFRVLPLAESWSSAESGEARVRVVHASADAPSVGIDVGNDDPAAPEVGNLDRFADTGSDGIAVPSNTPLQLGIDSSGARVTAFTTPALADGGDYFVIATGLLDKLPREDTGFSLLAIGPQGSVGFIKQNPTVVAMHASPDAPAVDLFTGDKELFDNLAFGALAPIQVPPGSYPIDVFGHTDGSSRPSGSPATSAMVGPLDAGERYLALATGFLIPSDGSNPLELVNFREQFDLTDTTNARIRAVHASPDAPAVDLGVAQATGLNPVLVPNLSYPIGTDESGLSIEPATVPLGVAPAGKDGTIVGTFMLDALAGQRAFAVAAGALDASHGQPFRIALVDTKLWPWTVDHVLPQ